MARTVSIVATSALVVLTLSCGGSANEERLAQLEAENEALRTRLAEQDAEQPRSIESTKPTRAGDDDWAWAENLEQATTPPERSTRPIIEPAPEPTPAPKPKPRKPAPEPQSKPKPEPQNRLEVPEPEPEPVRLETRTAAAGSSMEVLMQGRLDSQTSLVGDPVRARLDRDLLDARGLVVLPAGTVLTGKVTEVQAAKKVKKKSKLAFQFDTATLPDGSSVDIAAGRRLEGPGWDKKDGKIIGGSAAGGAVLGQVLGGDSESTAAGAVIGGAIASGVLMSEKGEPTVVEDGTAVELTLQYEVSVERPAT